MVLESAGRLAPDHQIHFARSDEAIRALEAFQCLFHFGPGGILPFLGKIGDQRLVEGEPLADHHCRRGRTFQPLHCLHAADPDLSEAGFPQYSFQPNRINQGTNTARLILPVCLAAMPGEDIQDDGSEAGFRLITWNLVSPGFA